MCQNDQCWEDAGYERTPGRAPRRLLYRTNAESIAGHHRCDGGKGEEEPLSSRSASCARAARATSTTSTGRASSTPKGPVQRRGAVAQEAGMTGDLGEVRVSRIRAPPPSACPRPSGSACSGRSASARAAAGDRGLATRSRAPRPPASCSAPRATRTFRSTRAPCSSRHPGAEIRASIGRRADFVETRVRGARADVPRAARPRARRARRDSHEAALAEIVRRRSEQPVVQWGLKSAELDAFLRQPAVVSERFHTELVDSNTN